MDAGEAACVAIGVTRGLVIATDDGDALRSLSSIDRKHPYERIRKLLIRAATTGLCSQRRANEIHADMRRAGFWDRASPFPDL